MISLMKFLGGDKISRRKFLATPDHSYFPDLYRGDEAWHPCVCGKAACQNFLFLFIIDLKLSKLAK